MEHLYNLPASSPADGVLCGGQRRDQGGQGGGPTAKLQEDGPRPPGQHPDEGEACRAAHPQR